MGGNVHTLTSSVDENQLHDLVTLLPVPTGNRANADTVLMKKKSWKGTESTC